MPRFALVTPLLTCIMSTAIPPRNEWGVMVVRASIARGGTTKHFANTARNHRCRSPLSALRPGTGSNNNCVSVKVFTCHCQRSVVVMLSPSCLYLKQFHFGLNRNTIAAHVLPGYLCQFVSSVAPNLFQVKSVFRYRRNMKCPKRKPAVCCIAETAI